MKDNISIIVSANLCLGCGICEDVCVSYKAIKIVRDAKSNYPKVTDSLCVECGLCLKICPGRGVDIEKISAHLYNDSDSKTDHYIGRYINCYSGNSNNYDIRFHCASGGMVSQFLIYLLEKKIIDGAIVVGFKKENPIEPYSYIATNRDEILEGKSSKYCVVSYETIIQQIRKRKGKYLIVGLPCHIHGFRKYEILNDWFKERIIGYFSIYCSGNKNYLSQKYILRKYKIKAGRLKSFSYRDDGCLGYLKAVYNNDQIIRVPYLKYYKVLRSFFTPIRCNLCTDYYGDLADISFGDIHVGEYKNDIIGINSIVVRSVYFNNLLVQAQSEGYITLTNISADIVNSSQAYMYKHKKGPGIIAALKCRSFFGKKIPFYDVMPQGTVKLRFVLREMQNWIFRRIGSITAFWFIIDLLDWITGGGKKGMEKCSNSTTFDNPEIEN